MFRRALATPDVYSIQPEFGKVGKVAAVSTIMPLLRQRSSALSARPAIKANGLEAGTALNTDGVASGTWTSTKTVVSSTVRTRDTREPLPRDTCVPCLGMDVFHDSTDTVHTASRGNATRAWSTFGTAITRVPRCGQNWRNVIKE